MVNHMRHTRGHTGNRRSHHALTTTSAVLCGNCGAPNRKHVICANCGFYKGRDVLGKTKKADKKEAKSAGKAPRSKKAKK
ncbi:MAG: 50S ribosomal protein L32 [bacterium]|jgi:large subunit ribosomal protein L32